MEEHWKRGRGAQINTSNRFLQINFGREHHESIDDWEEGVVATRFYTDKSKTIVNQVKSPDVSMYYSLNPYQGCEHGCIYCYARNSHEYWGFSAGIDFESRIIIKENAPELLRKKFESKGWEPAVISLSGNTDCYQPIERKMEITRKIIKTCLEYGNPVSIITKNALVLRDLDILQSLAAKNLTCVFFSVTSLDEDLRLKLEPRTSTFKKRLKTLETLSKHNIHTGIMNAPIIPGINDHHAHDVLRAAAERGAQSAGYTMVRLNGAIGDIFRDWLHKVFPDRADKVWNFIKSAHGGQVNDSRFGTRMKGEGKMAENFAAQFRLFCKKHGLNQNPYQYDFSQFKRPDSPSAQLTLF